MDEEAFWSIIDEARWACSGNGLKIPDLLEGRLSKSSKEELISFDELLIGWLEKSYSNELWAVYSVASGWTNIERFDNFRAWLIATGKDYLTSIINVPELLLHGFSPYDAEVIGKRVRKVGEHVFNEKFATQHPNPASNYSHRYKPIGKAVSFDDYKRLRKKYAALIKSYNMKPLLEFVLPNIRIEDKLLTRLSEIGLEMDIPVENIVSIAIENYITEHKKRSKS